LPDFHGDQVPENCRKVSKYIRLYRFAVAQVCLHKLHVDDDNLCAKAVRQLGIKTGKGPHIFRTGPHLDKTGLYVWIWVSERCELP